MSMGDPTVSGGGRNSFSLMVIEFGVKYVRELVKQNPVIQRNERLRIEWLVRGKQAISVGGASVGKDMQKEGAPIFTPDMSEYEESVSIMSSGFGALSFLKNAPHPHSARVFINWILTREGQEIFSRYNDKQSIRMDVGTDWLDPVDIRRPGVKYIRTGDEDFVLTMRDEHYKLAQEIFGPLMK